jgi:predicted nucleic acid-binding protein
MFLIDTNIFLEILLAQEKSELCKSFLTDNIRDLNMSDFSLHSIALFYLNTTNKMYIENLLQI